MTAHIAGDCARFKADVVVVDLPLDALPMPPAICGALDADGGMVNGDAAGTADKPVP